MTERREKENPSDFELPRKENRSVTKGLDDLPPGVARAAVFGLVIYLLVAMAVVGLAILWIIVRLAIPL
jgi:hypothetical protein